MNPRIALCCLTAFALVLSACEEGQNVKVASPTKPIRAAEPVVVAKVLETPDAPFRQSAPSADGKVSFVAPKVVEARLKNGLRVLLVERHEIPVVSVRLVIGAGAGDLDSVRPGLLSFLGAMMEQGTKTRSALQVSDDFESIGAQHGAWFEWDSGGTSIKVLADKLDAALEIMSDVALRPTFPSEEIERLSARRLAGIMAEKSSPGAIAQNALVASLFGRAHRYGHTLGGQETDAKKLTRPELVNAYQRLFTPKNAALVVAGDITRAEIFSKLEASFGGWKSTGVALSHDGPKPPVRTKSANGPTEKRIVLVDRPGAQSQIQIARPGARYATKDREALVVMNAILGGMFSSRINMNLRERNAYTYGAYSAFSMRHGAGPFVAGGSVFAAKTIPAIKEVFNELEGLRRDGPTADELALAKESIRLSMPGRFETTGDVAAAVSDIVIYDLPLDEFDQKLGRIEAISAGDVKRVAGEHLVSDTMTLIVVGDASALAPQLPSLGLGAFEERDAYGNPKTQATADPAAKAVPLQR